VSEEVSRQAENSVGIVGGGIIGMSIAWRLAQTGCRVAVYEKSAIGGEASWAGAGMLSPGGEIDSASPLSPLAIESRQLYGAFVRELEEASALAIDYQECGALDLAYSPDELEALELRAARQSNLGIQSKPVTKAHVSTFWPRVRTQNFAGARFYADDAIVNPREIVFALAAACRKSGVSIAQDCPVSRAVVSAGSVSLETVRGVQAHAAVVIAAGAWGGAIAVQGVPALPPAEPVKGHLIGYQQPEQTCHTILRHGHTYLLQRASGLLIAGSSIEHAGFDREIQPWVVASIGHRAEFVLPNLADATPSETWIGFRPESDALHIGAWHSPRFYLAYGHYRNGILLAPLTAQRVSAAVTASLGMR